jgi:hypothetical protein
MGKKEVIQPIGLSRREFLQLATLGGVGFVLGAAEIDRRLRTDSTFKIEFDGDDKSLSFEECSQLAIRMDKLYDKLPEYKPHMTQEDLLAWAMEMIPMFEYEGIVSQSKWPKIEGVNFFLFPDGESDNHVAGRSDCANYTALNVRYANPHSSWYEDDDAPFTLLHELAHIQQGQNICATANRDLVENSAQIGALEVAAALVNAGNKELLVPLISELRGMALSAAYAAALRTNQLDNFIEFRSKLSPGAFADARFAKQRRRWSSNSSELMTILDRYNVVPLLMISNAIRFNQAEISGLAFPEIHMVGSNPFTFHDEPFPIKLDDLAYFLKNAEQLVSESIVEK